MNELNAIVGQGTDRAGSPPKGKRFREVLDEIELPTTRCRYADVPRLAGFFKRLGQLTGAAGLVLIIATFTFMFLGTLDLSVGIYTAVTLLILTLLARSTCFVVARGLWIGADIEKNTRLNSEATLHLLKLVERQKDNAIPS